MAHRSVTAQTPSSFRFADETSRSIALASLLPAFYSAQISQLVLQKKKLRYTIHPSLPSKRPEWLVEKHGGQVPALSFRGGESLVGTMAIAEYLEEKYPDVCLTREGTYTYKQVLEKTKHFFPTLTAFILNKDPELDPELRANMHEQLDLIDKLLRSAPGRFLCGIEMTLADLYLAPQLFHVCLCLLLHGVRVRVQRCILDSCS